MALVNPNIALATQPVQTPNLLAMRQTAAQTQNQLARTRVFEDVAQREKETYNYETALSRSKDALRFINSPEQYLAWTESNFKDPVLGPVLQSMGVDPQQAVSTAMETLRQPGGLQTAIGRSAASIDQLATSMMSQGTQARNQARADANAARQAELEAQQRAQVEAVISGGAVPAPAPAATAPARAPAAQAFPVANNLGTVAGAAPAAPANRLAAAPGSAEAQIRQTYGMPPTDVTGQPVPAAEAPVPRTTRAAAPAPAASPEVDPRMAQLAALDELALQGNTLAEQRAKTIRDQMKFEKEMQPSQDDLPVSIQEYNLAVSQGYTGTFADFRREKAPQFEPEYAKVVGKASAERDNEAFTAAGAAASNLPKIYTTLDQLESSDAITGFGADVLKNVERFRAQFMADEEAGKRVADTEILDALLGSEVFPMIGALGIGARGLDTPAEREFLRQVMTGTISMDKDALIRLTEIRKNIAERAIDKYNSRVEKGEFDRFFRVQGIEPRKIQKPTRQAQPTASAEPPTVQSDAEYDALPSGTTFLAPDGTLRRKP